MTKYPHLFSPLEVGPLTFPNRLIFGPHVTNHWPDFRADEDTVAYYEERAKGGVGTIIIGSGIVDEDADYFPFNQAGLWSDDVVPGLARIAQAVQSHGTRLLIQIVHPGLHQNPDRDRLHRPAVSASQVPDVGRPFYIPKELSEHEIKTIQGRFAAAAVRAKAAGLDGVELHFAHGYLVNQFLTPLKNKRSDQYGGTLENRLRFGIEIVDSVRDAVGSTFVVGVRINNSDMSEGGLGPDDYANVARTLEATGKIDYISVSTALLRSIAHLVPTHYSDHAPGYQTANTSKVREAVESLPVFQVGRINTPELAEHLIAEGNADAIVMIRELIAEPFFAAKAESGASDDIRPCVYWNQGCVGRSNTGGRIECSLNPATAHERFYGEGTLRQASVAKRVLVVGGGPAGMECARIAALRGHTVALYEQQNQLGGQVQEFVKLPRRGEVSQWLDWLGRQVETARVTVRLGQAVREDNLEDVIDAESPDAIVIATGAKPVRDGRSALTTQPIPGWRQENVLTYEDVLAGADLGDTVLVVDEQGERTSPGLAELLAETGKQVEIITRWPNASTQWLSFFNEIDFTYANFDKLGITVTPNTWVKNIHETTVTCFNVYTGREWVKTADSIVLVTSKYSCNELHALLASRGFGDLHEIGDAVAPRWISDATREGVRVAYSL
jgi:2,4-dienoyl-CoA reductase-like NADH-dependent reductase (Old Yellow Enzyme family)